MMKNLNKRNAPKSQTFSKKVVQEALFDDKEKTTADVWIPTYEWYIKTTSIVLIFLIVIFLVLNIVLEPYLYERAVI